MTRPLSASIPAPFHWVWTTDTFRSSAGITRRSSGRVRWTWVFPEYQPRAAMSIQRSRTMRQATVSPGAIDTLASQGRYSLPRSTRIRASPAGSDTRKRFPAVTKCAPVVPALSSRSGRS